jgi:putative methionine-R-sulfoxide reductase with GAF domain
MATSTAIASLETLVVIHRSNNPDEIYDQLISNFKRVPHFDWIGVYIQQGTDMVLKASSNDHAAFSIARQSIIQIPICGKKETLGKITVMSHPSHRMDESDYIALAKIGEELGKKLTLLNTSA